MGAGNRGAIPLKLRGEYFILDDAVAPRPPGAQIYSVMGVKSLGRSIANQSYQMSITSLTVQLLFLIIWNIQHIERK